MAFRGVILLIFVMVSACSRHSPAPVKEVKPRKYNRVHQKRMTNRHHPKQVVVKKGDTLYSLGFKYSIDYKELAKINHIKAPYHIYPGQKLRLKAPKGRSNTAQSHPVQIKPVPKGRVEVAKNSSAKPASNKPVSVAQNVPIKKKPVIKTPVKKPVAKPPTQQPIVSNTPVKPVDKPANKPASAAPANGRWLWPVKGPVLSTFSSADVSRKGIDIGAKKGSSVVAINNGTVVYSGDGLRGYGELVIIKHTDNLLSAYAHNSQRLVKEGQAVKQGQQIAKSGTGNDGKALLHFEIRKNGQPVNPLKYLPKR